MNPVCFSSQKCTLSAKWNWDPDVPETGIALEISPTAFITNSSGLIIEIAQGLANDLMVAFFYSFHFISFSLFLNFLK
jgi:hypothetical protein